MAVVMDKAAYTDQLLALLPTGEVWPRDSNTVLVKALDMPAAELARIDQRAADLFEESDPRTTDEMLSDWERMLGLPDPCMAQALGIEERRAAVVEKLTMIGGQSRQYFIDRAARLGFPITITEFDPYITQSLCDDILYDDLWQYAWLIHAPEVTIFEMTADGECTDRIRWWGNELLECVINRIKPAHTFVMFGYGEEI